jgi:hypothetical protein
VWLQHTRVVIYICRVWFPHAECDIYTQSVIFTRRVWFLHAYWNFHTQCDVETHKCVTDREVFDAIRWIKSEALGLDGISIRFLRLICNTHVQYGTDLLDFSRCLEDILPVLKIPNLGELRDYRPISVHSKKSRVDSARTAVGFVCRSACRFDQHASVSNQHAWVTHACWFDTLACWSNRHALRHTNPTAVRVESTRAFLPCAAVVV